MKYQLYMSGDEDTFSDEENCKDLIEKGLAGNNPKLVWEIEANTWTEAMTKYHKYRGWEPYVLFEDDNETV